MKTGICPRSLPTIPRMRLRRPPRPPALVDAVSAPDAEDDSAEMASGSEPPAVLVVINRTPLRVLETLLLLRGSGSELRACDGSDDLLRRCLMDIERGDTPAKTHHNHAVDHLEDIRQVVRDDDDAQSLLA